MHIADSQVHLWAAESPSRPWPPGRAAEAQKPYQILKETLLFQMDLAGVSRVVLVPPSWEGDRNDAALEAARAASRAMSFRSPSQEGGTSTMRLTPARSIWNSSVSLRI